MEEPASRQFYSLPSLEANEPGPGTLVDENETNENESSKQQSQSQRNLFSYVADNIIGSEKVFSGPYGLRTAVYLDYTASGRSLQFIEDYIQHEVLPEYGNTHTTTSITSLQTTLFRHEARDIIRNSCNASEHDSVIFVGSGTTGAVHKLIHSLNLTECPIVFVGPHEHHSNILPWMEVGAEVIRISLTSCGGVDIKQLEEYLSMLQPFGRQMIGAFSAASNITGVMTDVNAVTVTLHKYGALAFWDYAAAAPYVKVDVNPYVGGIHQDLVYKDAVYFSVHKFVGGVGTPGVLIAKKKLFKNPVPHSCGGGTVFYVRRDHHRYLVEPEVKEEGGTPDIVGSIRAGLAFQLRNAIGASAIACQDAAILSRAFSAWRDVPNLVVLGPMPDAAERLPIISFMVYHRTTGLFLHHNFVAAVLNDVFGIQARGGCACAGPYAMDILGMSEGISKKMEELLAEDSRLDRIHLRRVGEYSHREIIRPGFVRINIPYFLDDSGVDFVIEAVRLVSQHAWKLLPQYLFNPETGEWRNKNFQTFKDRKWLGHISYSSGQMSYHQPAPVVKGPLPTNHRDCLEKAMGIFNHAEKTSMKMPDQSLMFDEQARVYRWFLLPSEANVCLQKKWKQEPFSPTKLPFCPPELLKRLGQSSLLSSTTEGSKWNQARMDEVLDRVKFKKSKELLTSQESCNIKKETVLDCNEQRNTKIQDAIVGVDVEKEEREMGSIREGGGDKQLTVQETNANSTNILEVLDRGFVTTGGVVDNGGDGERGPEGVVKHKDNCDYNEVKGTENVCCRCDQIESADISHRISTGLSISGSGNKNRNSSCSAGGCDGDNIAASLKGVAAVVVDDEKASTGEDVDSNIVNCDNPGNSRCLVRNDIDNKGKVEGDIKDIKQSNSDTHASATHSSRDGEGSSGKANGKEPNTGEAAAAVKGEKGSRWFAPPKTIFKPAVQALEEYNMLHDGDKVLVCLSGGKDSLSLLHTIRQYQFYAKKKGVSFTFGAVTVDPQTPAYDPSPLKIYLAHLGVPYFYESQCIMETATNLPYECASICSFCSRMKRGRIYAAARREGYNVLALGQHLDDLAESFLMSFLHNGSLSTMKAHYTVKEGDLRVIRPFVYVRETELRSFAEQERHRTKQLLAAQEVIFPQVYSSMMSALKPLMARGRRTTDTPPSSSSSASLTTTTGATVDNDDDDDIDL